MELLIGLTFMALLIGGLVYLVIFIARGGRKAVFKNGARKMKVDAAQNTNGQFVFKRKILPDLIVPVLWIAGFSTLMFSSADFYTALFGVFILCWFMVFRIYYVVSSRNDSIILNGNKIEFTYKKDAATINVSDFQNANLEFRKISARSQSLILPYLVFGPGTEKEVAITSSVLKQNPYEVTEAVHRLNSNLRIRKSWNDTIKKKVETAELLPAV